MSGLAENPDYSYYGLCVLVGRRPRFLLILILAFLLCLLWVTESTAV